MNTRRLPVLFGALLGAGLLLPATGLAQRQKSVAEVSVAPADAQVTVGGQQPFVAQAFDNANNSMTATFTWTSSNTAVATINSDGIATGVGPGATIITARTGTGRTGKSASVTLQVLAAGAVPVPQGNAAPSAPPAAPPQPATGGRPAGNGCAAMDREPNGSGPAEGLIFTQLRITLVKGERKQLEYRAVRGDGENADRVCVVFSVDTGGGRVAAVDSLGMVVATNDTGKATVRAVVPGRTSWQPKQISVEVHGDSVRFPERELSMAPGMVDTLHIVVPSQNNRVIDFPVGVFQFQSTDTAKVRVSPVAPIITAVSPGRARVVAQSNLYPDIPITINVHRPVAGLMVVPADTVVTVAISGTHALRVEARAADTTVIPEAPLHWTLPDSTLVRFDTATKTLHGVKVGDTRIQVSVPAGKDSLVRAWRVRVVAGGLALSRTKVALALGDRTPIAVQLLDDRRQPIPGAAGDLVTWSSSDTTVARVANGQIVTVGLGHALLTARARWDSVATADVYVVGDLIVSTARMGRYDLYMVARGDSLTLKQRALTQDSAIETQPAWSPSWMQIAYVAAPGVGSSNYDLYVANADGSGARRLTNDSATVQSPSYVGPSGEQIVFESNKGGLSELYIINRDGTGSRVLTHGDQNFMPDVSPDGRKIIFYSLRQTARLERHYNVYQMNLDGTGEEQVTNNPRREIAPAYAPDGRSFFYLRDEGGSPPTMRVYQRDLATKVDTPITPNGVFVQGFRVSADGAALAMTVAATDAKGAQTTRVVVFDIATKAMTDLRLPGADRVLWPRFRPAQPH